MLTLDLIDRLLASTIVPREAKLAAVESWRRELASMRDKRQDCRRLERRLAAASRVLVARRPWSALGEYLSGALAPAPQPMGYPRQ
jgi:hypothetical protein